MKEKAKKGNSLPVVNIPESTQTKGKVSSKFTIVDDTECIEQIEKLDKNKVFQEVNDWFCPVKFDDTQLRNSLQPLVNSGIMSEEVFSATLNKAKSEFLNNHSEEIESANHLNFAEVVSKLKSNESLYNKVLKVCNISELVEGDYINENGVQIFRANQCLNNDGTNRYKDVSLSRIENGQIFTQSLFVEYREVTTSNIILSVRYRQSYIDAIRKLSNQVSDYKRILANVAISASKAKENGFSKEQIFAEIEKIFAE